MKLQPGDTTAWATGLRRWGRRVAHLLAIVAGWALFVWGWQRVLARGTDFSQLRLLILGAAIVVPVVTVSWILHNRGIHRRKGPRRSVPAAALDYHMDFVGRTVVAEFGKLKHAQRVDIEVEGALKRYREHSAVSEGEADPASRAELLAPDPLEAGTPRNAEAAQALTEALTQAAAPAGRDASAHALRSTEAINGERSGDSSTRANS